MSETEYITKEDFWSILNPVIEFIRAQEKTNVVVEDILSRLFNLIVDEEAAFDEHYFGKEVEEKGKWTLDDILNELNRRGMS